MKKILIIDDDRVLRQTLAAALEAEGYGVAEAGDGREGLNKALKGAFDLIVMDVVMPAMTGLEVCRSLREAGRQVPVIVLSGKKKKEIDKVLGLELGGDDYMTKPFGTDEFIARVHAVLRRSKPEVLEIDDVVFGSVNIDFRKKIATKAGAAIKPGTAIEAGTAVEAGPAIVPETTALGTPSERTVATPSLSPGPPPWHLPLTPLPAPSGPSRASRSGRSGT
jgi:DNA-binding response OmpR family regulator